MKTNRSFRWKKVSLESFEQPLYVGVLHGRLLILGQEDKKILYHCVGDECDKALPVILEDYFQLNVDLEYLYKQWAEKDPIFERISIDYPGVRMLRQDPVENVFSFICSANNNISRISAMVEKLCTNYGQVVGEWEGETYYSFPTLEALASPGIEEKLREMGFGYRAKYIQQAAGQIIELGGREWLLGLRKSDYGEAKKKLLQLSGIGPKVADCILLMSLDKPDAIPVDTHMFNIAKRYLPHLTQYKTVTDKVYSDIADHFRGLYGEYAGWAHSVLFSADLRHFQSLKPESDVKQGKESPTKRPLKEESDSRATSDSDERVKKLKDE